MPNYSEQWVPEYQGNPLIEALPVKLPDEEMLLELAVRLSIEPEFRVFPKYKREDFLYRLKKFRQPLPDYLTCFRMVERAIKESYCPRNPFSAQTAHYLHNLEYSETAIVPNGGVISPEGTAMSLVGESGVGKTKMLEQVIKFFPQVINHTKYKSVECPIAQVVWIKVTCPGNASLSGLCRSILKELDRALKRPLTKPSSSSDGLIEQIEMEVRNHFVGILIIDEMQNLNLQKVGGAKNLIGFILSLINRSGIPTLFCANPQFIGIIQSEFKTARRAEAAGYISMRRMNQAVWEMFIPVLWELQVTKVFTPLTEDMSQKLYRYSQGIIDVAVRIFERMQVIALDDNDESITLELIDVAYEEVCQLTDKGLSLLRDSNLDPVSSFKRKKLYELYDDLIADADYEFEDILDNSTPPSKSKDISAKKIFSSLKNQENREKSKDPLHKIHHPELEKQLLDVLSHDSPAELIVETDLVSQLIGEPEDPRYNALFCEHIDVDALNETN